MAATATGAGHSLDMIAEVTYGTTPATPAFVDVRHTSCSIGLSKSSFESAELRSDRQIANYRHGNKTVAGAIGIEMSYGSHDTLLEACMGGTWATNVLKAGVTRRSFTFERLFSNLDVPEYHRYTGAEVNKISVSIKPDAIVTGTIDIMAQGMDTPATAIITGATYGAATTTLPFDSFTGTITEGGTAIAIVTAIDFSIENGLSGLFVIGNSETLQHGIGKSRVTGSVTAFFQSSTLLNKFVNETASSMVVTLTALNGADLIFDFGNILYNGGQPDVEGEGEVTITLPFIALYDSGDASQLVITRAP